MDPIVRQFPIKTICFENVLLLFPITSKTEHSDLALWVSCQHPSALAASFLRRKVTSRTQSAARGEAKPCHSLLPLCSQIPQERVRALAPFTATISGRSRRQ